MVRYICVSKVLQRYLYFVCGNVYRVGTKRSHVRIMSPRLFAENQKVQKEAEKLSSDSGASKDDF